MTTAMTIFHQCEAQHSNYLSSMTILNFSLRNFLSILFMFLRVLVNKLHNFITPIYVLRNTELMVQAMLGSHTTLPHCFG